MTNAHILGAEIMGNMGQVGASRLQRNLLAALSVELVSVGRTTGTILRRLLSTCLHALMFRRPALSVLARSYQNLPDPSDDSFVRLLAADTRQELLILAIIAPPPHG